MPTEPSTTLPVSTAQLESVELLAAGAPHEDQRAAAAAQLRAQAKQAARLVLAHPDWDPPALTRHLSSTLGISSEAAHDLLVAPETQAAATELRQIVLHGLAQEAAAAWREEMANLRELAADAGVDASVRVKASGKRVDAASAMLATTTPVSTQPTGGQTQVTVVNASFDYRTIAMPALPDHPGARGGG